MATRGFPSGVLGGEGVLNILYQVEEVGEATLDVGGLWRTQRPGSWRKQQSSKRPQVCQGVFELALFISNKN